IAAALAKKRNETDERREAQLAANLEERNVAMAIPLDDRDARRKAILEVTAKEQETQKLADEIAKYYVDIERNEATSAAARKAAAAALGDSPRIGALVSMGEALRWDDVHPLIRAAFKSPTLVGLIPFAGTRKLAAAALPFFKHVPWLLSIYLNPKIVDLSKSRDLAKTVEDPNRHLNRDLAIWLNRGDAIIDGKNLTEEFARRVRCPLLSVVALGDGIVPQRSAMSAHIHGRMGTKDVIEVGTDDVHIAHADLFVSDYAEGWLFRPMGEWLAKQNVG
ncbi:MAG: hypothetical protein HY906_03510, partial [Deltaproteobacteria bacterium]|nr:hypothetical protein [Deltaproteobacteria bacterium]